MLVNFYETNSARREIENLLKCVSLNDGDDDDEDGNNGDDGVLMKFIFLR